MATPALLAVEAYLRAANRFERDAVIAARTKRPATALALTRYARMLRHAATVERTDPPPP